VANRRRSDHLGALDSGRTRSTRGGAKTPRGEYRRLAGLGAAARKRAPLVVAIDQVLAFESRVRRLTDDAELAKARARFDAVGPDAKELRNLVAHLDACPNGSSVIGIAAEGSSPVSRYLSITSIISGPLR
jgi:hypothetical protein